MAARGARQRLALIALSFVVLTVVSRLATMDGLLAGFGNDDLLHVSRAQQIVLGDFPVRDFAEVGMPLTEAMSAAAQLLFGRRLLSEFALTATLLGLSAALLFLLAAKASGSAAIGVIVALAQVAMEPRFYNYPKLLMYALAIPLLWSYLDRPTTGRAAWLGGMIAVAFLFRHDHGVYVGVAVAVAVVAGSFGSLRPIARRAGVVAAVSLLVLAPYLLFVQMNGGVIEYVRSAVVWASRDAARTARPPQRIDVDWSAPWLAVRPEPAPLINIRWAERTTPEQRRAREQAHGMALAADAPGAARYALSDWSPARLEAIVRDPAVEDTHGIDRRRFVIDDPEFRRQAGIVARTAVLPGVLRADNAIPFLFFLFSALPFAALGVLLATPPTAADVRWPHWRSKILVVVVLGVLVNTGFLRGALESRVADVTVPIGVLAAWLAARALGMTRGPARTPIIAAVVVVAVLAGTSIEATAGVSRRVRLSGVAAGPAAVASRVSGAYARLQAIPPAAAYPADQPGVVRLAHYLQACTAPADRVFVLAYLPELLVLSARGFAGGLPAVQPGFFQTEAEQRQTLARVDPARVPIVVTMPDEVYTADYRPRFFLIDAFLTARYRDAGPVDLGDGTSYRVLVRRDLPAAGVDDVLGLPCFR